MRLYFATALLASQAWAQPPQIVAEGGRIRLAVPSNGDVGITRAGGSFLSLVTSDQLEDQISSLQATLSTVEADNSNLRASLDAVGTENLNLRVSLVETNATATALSTAVQALASASTTTFCATPSAPTDGAVATPIELVAGTSVTYSCDVDHALQGEATSTCLSTGTMSSVPPTCPLQDRLGSQANPAPSCRAIYADFEGNNRSGTLSSGPQWLRLHPNDVVQDVQVYCDMDTPASDGFSGWTLCGKLDANRDGPQFLRQGFGRADTNVADMASLSTFSGTGMKWSSIDCRPLFNRQTQWMMHANGESPRNPGDFEAVRFTNVLPDVKINAENLFDTVNDDRGACRPRQSGGIQTFDESWTMITSDGVEGDRESLGVGQCLVGDGHHFCSFGRAGTRFSNGGQRAGGTYGNLNCQGSASDTVYWAWLADDHGCSPTVRIGTGCDRANGQSENSGTGGPSSRHNFLFVY